MEGRAGGPAALSGSGLVGRGPLRQSVPFDQFSLAVTGPVWGAGAWNTDRSQKFGLVTCAGKMSPVRSGERELLRGGNVA